MKAVSGMLENVHDRATFSMLSQLNTTSLRLLPYLENNADFDGLIIVSKWQIENEGFMTPKLVGPAIESLLKNGLLYRNNYEELFLNYTHSSDIGFFNISIESKFTKVIKSMHKRLILLFYYFLLREQPENWIPVDPRDLDSFPYKYRLVNSPNDLLINIIQLITLGLIEVKLESQIVLTEGVANPKEQIQDYYRENRMGGRESLIHIRANPTIIKNTEEQNAMRSNIAIKEFDIIAMDYHCSISSFAEEFQADIYDVKHKIFCKHGNPGMRVYRNSLRAFFEEYEWKFDNLIEGKKFTDIFRDQFFVPHMEVEVIREIKKL